MNIYVGNLDYKVDENDLKSLFAEYGEVTTARVLTDKFNGRSKGFGFVEMADDADAKKAISKLDGMDMEGRPLTVNEARPKEDSARRSRY